MATPLLFLSRGSRLESLRCARQRTYCAAVTVLAVDCAWLRQVEPIDCATVHCYACVTRLYATVCFGLRTLSLYILKSEQAEDLSLLYLVNYPFLLSSPLRLFQSLKSLKLTSSIPFTLSPV